MLVYMGIGIIIGFILCIISILVAMSWLLWRYPNMFDDAINEGVKTYLTNWDVVGFINLYKAEWIAIAETKMNDPETQAAIAAFIEELKDAIGL